MSGCMKHFTLEEIARACGGKYVGNEDMKNTPITSVERDSREIKDGSLFLAIKGERVDGHDYIEKCYQSGAVCAICERPVENAQKPYILVESTLEAVKKIDDELTIHDFRIVKGDTHTNVIFDLVVPYDCQKSEDEIKTLAKQNIQKIDQKLMPVIYVERSFVE